MRRTILRITVSLIGFAVLLALAAVASRAADPVEKPGDDAKRKHLDPMLAKSYPQMVLASKPAGYWRLEEMNGKAAFDETKQNRNGKYYGGAALGETGALKHPVDKAVGFDGKGAYVEIPSDRAFSQPTSGKGLTVEVWMKPRSLEFKGETDDPYVHWIGKGERGQYEWALRFYSRKSTRPNRISAYIFNRSGGLGAGAYVQEPLQPNEWIHIVACFDAGSRNNPNAGVSIYKNGVLKGSPATQRGARYSSYDIIPQAGAAPVRLGTRDFTSFFAGALDEFAIYPRVLNSAEIMAHYRAGSGR